jgi:exopolysaccharide production protein ExoZ
MVQSRNISLDYLRGLCALAIMLFHFIGFSRNVVFDSAHFLGRMGVYGVSIFYVLSGLTLFMVYGERLNLLEFYVRRFFRIFPLLWVVIFLSILIRNSHPPLNLIILNVSGLFGFVKWWGYIGTGVWSIGNELVFYASFPLIIFLIQRNRSLFLLFASLIFATYLAFAFVILDEHNTLSEQWRNYINPLNQVGLFLAGIFIGLLFRQTKVGNRLCGWYWLWPSQSLSCIRQAAIQLP